VSDEKLAAHAFVVANAIEAAGDADAFDVPVLLRQLANALTAAAPRRAPPEPSAEAIQAFQRAYDADESCQDGEGIYCVRCVTRALRAAYAVDRPAPTVPESQWQRLAEQQITLALDHALAALNNVRIGRGECRLHLELDARAAAPVPAAPEGET